MSQNKSLSLSRRNFLKTSLLAGGGMLIGFNFLSACKPEAILPIDISNLNFNDFNAFIKISDEGYITIFSPNPEIGQGVKTSMPMIIAEELDVAWEKVSVAQGFYDPKNYQRQVAGGSQSIRFGWDALRQTGATTKQMLVNAAAIQWGVEPNTCFASQGNITNANGDTLGYRSCYDEGKRCAETLFMDYNREHNLNIRIVRIFNTYGPNMTKNDGRVVSNFILQALKGDDITVYGDGSQTRSFQFIDDLVNGLIKMMNSDSVGPINLGNPIELSMKDLATMVIRLTNSLSNIIYKDLPEDDPKRRRPDISLAKSLLDWSPIIDLETGLKKTINYFTTH